MWGLPPKETRHKYLKAAEVRCIQLRENTVTALSLSDGRRLMNTLFASANVISLIRCAQRVACWLTWRWMMSLWMMLVLFDPFRFDLLPASERLERAHRKDRCVGWYGRCSESWIQRYLQALLCQLHDFLNIRCFVFFLYKKQNVIILLRE